MGSSIDNFLNKDKKCGSFDEPDKFLLNQLPKSKRHHKIKIQDMNSRFCGSHCLYFFYVIERINY